MSASFDLLYGLIMLQTITFVETSGDPDEDEEESKLWTELSSERVLRAIEAALGALHILTAPNMPKRAYIEDVIERIVQLARFQLQHSIYPAYDPVYRTESKKKDVMISGTLQ